MKMDNSRRRIESLVLRLFETLLPLYPPRFRTEFSAEIRASFLSRLHETQERGRLAWLAAAFHEIRGLGFSILHERWHELRARKEKTMDPEDQLQKDPGAEGGRLPQLQPAGVPGTAGAPGARWVISWTLLTTAAVPAAVLIATPLAVMLMGLINLGVKAGFWHAANMSILVALGFVTGLALGLSLFQWYLLRKYLPRAWLWFAATGAGILLGALAVGLALGRSSVQSWDPIWIMPAVALPMGLILGLAQWLYLRSYLPNALWIILIDVLAVGSILLVGRSFTSLAELMVVFLPGAITGLGLWLLLRQSRLEAPRRVQTKAIREKSRRIPRLALAGVGVLALVPLFFACSWVYAASQLALAKNAGVYPTVEEAVIGNNSQGWGGARVVSIGEVQAGPNRSDGAQPHVWFGGATVYLDRIPKGHTRADYPAYSFYLRVRDGWVHVGEGAFPGFIGWVMELYNMEGVRQQP
jgi:hypothetical protein